MSPKLAELIAKLREILQIDKPELDFGIYRIIRARAAQINRFLDGSLPQKVRAVLTQNAAAEKAAIEAEIAAAEQAARGAGIAVDAAPKVLELRSRLAAVDSALADSESVVYAHLLAFFSRYYDAGDFISKRRYKGDVYAVPYAGEEVKLHWANADQYYTKTGENFTDYSFRLSDGARVNFKLVSAAVAKDNVKDADAVRCFTLWDPEEAAAASAEEPEADDAASDAAAGDDDVPASALPDKILDEKNGELFIYFQYKKFPKGTKQKELAKDAREKIAAELTRADLLTKFPLLAPAPTENDRARTVLDRELARYVAKNTSDYFIHKDLKGFLTRELDFYVKNEMMQLDDIQNAATFRQIESGLRRIQAVRAVALELIDFMAQLEEFQKSLWLKKKFVVQCDYCFTLDRVPAEMLEEVLANAAQKAEWEKLGFPPLPEAVPAGELFPAERKLDSRMVDTKFFPPSFKEKLLASIDDIDEQCDGVLVRSENFQALNLLRERYRGQIKCIYIDPPYNTGESEILYKNTYKNSSWMTLMENRISRSLPFLSPRFVYYLAIDDYEMVPLSCLVDSYGKFRREMIVVNHHPQGGKAKTISSTHEYMLTLVDVQNSQTLHGRNSRNDEIERRAYKRAGTAESNFRANRPNSFYAILVDPKTLKVVGAEPPPKLHSEYPTEKTKDGYVRVYPLGINNTERVWRNSYETALSVISAGKLESSESFVIYQLLRNEDKSTALFSNWTESKYNAGTNGAILLRDILGCDVFSYPKSIYTVQDAIVANDIQTGDIVFDYFAGSGTTGHAVINLNREDGGKRKYILVEMGEHFETVLKPRIEKVVYSPNWKNGKPQDSDQGVSHCFKYMTLESYEDALTNLELADAGGNVPAGMLDQYLLHYMLRTEARAARLSTEDFRKPFGFKLNIAVDASGATEPRNVDLVETFNWLLGLRVRRLVSRREKGYVRVEGELPDGRRALILWRDCEKIDDSALAGTLERLSINLRSDADFDIFYVNGDHALPNVSVTDGDDASARKKVLQIEDEFLRRMFEEDV